MPFVATGGPRSIGKRSSYKVTNRWRVLEKHVDDAAIAAAYRLKQDILTYLYANLHRWTGEMADRAFVEVYFQGGRIVVRFGSHAEHTFWHEVRYHPQIRETADIWLPKIGQLIRDEIRNRPMPASVA